MPDRPVRPHGDGMAGKPSAKNETAIDRRTFISGGWIGADPLIAPAEGDIASILVQARPARLAEVEAAIAALPGCEIHGRDPKGKLVVVIDAPSSSAVGETLSRITLLEGVLSASLVFHAVDAG